jgi:hypothetical protein
MFFGVEEINTARGGLRVIIDPDLPLESRKAGETLGRTQQMLGLLGIVLPPFAPIVHLQELHGGSLVVELIRPTAVVTKHRVYEHYRRRFERSINGMTRPLARAERRNVPKDRGSRIRRFRGLRSGLFARLERIRTMKALDRHGDELPVAIVRRSGEPVLLPV